MDKKAFRLASAVAIIGLGLVLGGCAAIQNEEARQTEQLLSAAGFEMKVADTPEKLDHLQTLTQRKLVRHQRDGKTYFVYADANDKCMYVGDEKAYQEYQKLQVQKDIADENRMTAIENENAAMRWDTWGPWRRWW